MLDTILDFVVHYSHSVAFECVLCYYFRQDWRALGATTQPVREAMKLPPNDPTLAEKVKQIRRAQRSAVWRMRAIACFMMLILYITVSATT